MNQFLLVLGIILGLIVIIISTILGGLYFNGTIWVSAGVGIILISFSLYKYSSSREAGGLARAEQERLVKLMNDGVKVVVDLSKM